MDFVGEAWTPEAVMFSKFCMSKRKNLDSKGGCAPGTPPTSANTLLYEDNMWNNYCHILPAFAETCVIFFFFFF